MVKTVIYRVLMFDGGHATSYPVALVDTKEQAIPICEALTSQFKDANQMAQMAWVALGLKGISHEIGELPYEAGSGIVLASSLQGVK